MNLGVRDTLEDMPEFGQWGFSAEDGMQPLCAWCGKRTLFERGRSVCRSDICRYRVMEKD